MTFESLYINAFSYLIPSGKWRLNNPIFFIRIKAHFLYFQAHWYLQNITINSSNPTAMKSMFTLQEVGNMLNMSLEDIEEEIDEGYLSYSFNNGEKKITLYDLEKYMGAEQTRKITQAYLGGEES